MIRWCPRMMAGLILGLCVTSTPAPAQSLPEAHYWLYVAAESEDQVALVRFGPEGFDVEKTIEVGVRSTEIEGPHGVRVSPDGDYWYVSIAHGNPYGAVHKYRTGSDAWEASVEVGMFPATMDIAPSTGLLYASNFDLHGDMRPGTVSVLDTHDMFEVARIEVGVMPHGSRLNGDGDRHYSVMMMSDELVEADAWSFEVIRRLPLSDHARRPMPGMPMGVVRPTWVEPSSDGERLFVALNGADRIVEVDVASWEIGRVFDTAPGPYNIALSPDGRWMVATCRTDGSTMVWDLASGGDPVRVVNSRGLSHGVVVSPDSRYAFVSVEGAGGEPGSVDVIDLLRTERVDSVDIGKQASGIGFWKMER